MIKFISKAALAAVLLGSSLFAQGSDRQETVQHVNRNGMTCWVYGVNGASLTSVIYEPKIGGYSFGYSDLFVVDNYSSSTLFYNDGNHIIHMVTPQWVWAAWTNGLGTVSYNTMTY